MFLTGGPQNAPDDECLVPGASRHERRLFTEDALVLRLQLQVCHFLLAPAKASVILVENPRTNWMCQSNDAQIRFIRRFRHSFSHSLSFHLFFPAIHRFFQCSSLLQTDSCSVHLFQVCSPRSSILPIAGSSRAWQPAHQRPKIASCFAPTSWFENNASTDLFDFPMQNFSSQPFLSFPLSASSASASMYSSAPSSPTHSQSLQTRAPTSRSNSHPQILSYSSHGTIHGQGQGHGPHRKWTPAEDNLLRRAVTLFPPSTKNRWRAIAAHVKKDENACHQRWNRVLDPHIRKEDWTLEEYVALAQAVGRLGMHAWSKVAACVPMRTDVMCRSTWKKIEKVALMSNSSGNRNAFTNELQRGREAGDPEEEVSFEVKEARALQKFQEYSRRQGITVPSSASSASPSMPWMAYKTVVSGKLDRDICVWLHAMGSNASIDIPVVPSSTAYEAADPHALSDSATSRSKSPEDHDLTPFPTGWLPHAFVSPDEALGLAAEEMQCMTVQQQRQQQQQHQYPLQQSQLVSPHACVQLQPQQRSSPKKEKTYDHHETVHLSVDVEPAKRHPVKATFTFPAAASVTSPSAFANPLATLSTSSRPMQLAAAASNYRYQTPTLSLALELPTDSEGNIMLPL